MEKEQRHAATVRFVAGMQAGQSWQTAAASAGLQISQSNAYRLMNAVQQHGEAALKDGRQGHPVKLRGEVRALLEDTCRKAPRTPSSTVQKALRERFALNVSVSQINRVRAALGISNCRKSLQQEKKRPEREALLHPNGKKVLGVYCYSLLLVRRGCFLN